MTKRIILILALLTLASIATGQLTPCADPNFLKVSGQVNVGMGAAQADGLIFNPTGERDRERVVAMNGPVGQWWYSGACHELPYNRYGNQCIMQLPNGRAIADSFTELQIYQFWDTVALNRWLQRGYGARQSPTQYESSGLAQIYATAAADYSLILQRDRGILGENIYARAGIDGPPMTEAECLTVSPLPTPIPTSTPDPTTPTVTPVPVTPTPCVVGPCRQIEGPNPGCWNGCDLCPCPTATPSQTSPPAPTRTQAPPSVTPVTPSPTTTEAPTETPLPEATPPAPTPTPGNGGGDGGGLPPWVYVIAGAIAAVLVILGIVKKQRAG